MFLMILATPIIATAENINTGDIPVFLLRSTYDISDNERNIWYNDFFSRFNDIILISEYSDSLVLVTKLSATVNDIYYAAGGFSYLMQNPVSIVFYVGHGCYDVTRVSGGGPPIDNPYFSYKIVVQQKKSQEDPCFGSKLYDFYIWGSKGEIATDDNIWKYSSDILGTVVFLWSCFQGWIPSDAYFSGINDMPTAWLHDTNFLDPDYNKVKCYIGFVQSAPQACTPEYSSDLIEINLDNKELTFNSEVTAFVYAFYYYFVGRGYNIKNALDSASKAVFNCEFEECPFYTQYGLRTYGSETFSILHLWAVSNYSDNIMPPGGV